MYGEKDHLCTGSNCIFCRIFTVEEAQLSSQTLMAQQSLTSIEAMPQAEGEVPKALEADQVDRLEVIEKLAFYDQQTGIYNAHTFMRELQEEVVRAQRYKRPLSICMVIVDQFNEIKSKYGPLGAEIVLKHMADLLKESLRGVDMAAHFQDEKFAIILPETNNAGALIVAQRLAKLIANRPLKLNWQTINLNASIGVATFLKHAQSCDEMIRVALAAVTNKAN
jgi:two-component system cell cycle response regulator